MVLIDTSAWVEFLRRGGDLEVKVSVGNLRDELKGGICGPVEMELLGGALECHREGLGQDLKLLPYFRSDHRLWKEAALNFRKLREKAVTAPWTDILIATIALNHSCRVYAVDRHFQLMAPILGIRLYEPGINGQYRPDTDASL